MPFDVVFDWGDRSRKLQARLKHKVAGVSFWLTPAISPVKFGAIAPKDLAGWDVATTMALAVQSDPKTPTIATVTVPNNAGYVRLDFDLSATVNGQTSTVLSFRQLFLATNSMQSLTGAAGSGVLLPTQFSMKDDVLAPSKSGPFMTKGPSATGRRTALGLHPLLSLGTPGQFLVNAEFVDVTQLWWLIHPDTKWGWYWHPDIKGRQEHLRVLAWTGGGNPMIWFAAIPDALVPIGNASTNTSDTHAPPADIVYFRPPPMVNSFVYTPDANGFAATDHDNKTLFILARYLLSPIAESTFLALQSSGAVKAPELLADQVQPTSLNPIKPTDPMDLLSTASGNSAFTDIFPNTFRPVGLETAVNRTGAPHLLLLPLGFEGYIGNNEGGYEAVVASGLKATVASALVTLWNANAIARDKTTAPTAADRNLWIAGHSAGNGAVWACLNNNAIDVQRVISFDAKTLKDEGLPALRKAGASHKQKPLDAFIITTPFTGGPEGLIAEMDAALRALRAVGILVTVLPDFAQRSAYWHLPPPPPPFSNTFLLYLLAKWNVPTKADPTKTLLDISPKTRGRWNSLFFHEMAVFGGELVQPPANPPSASGTPGGSNTPRPFVRTFFEMALGPPNPRPK
jgi:hypothetical protein